jgi:histone deacetylase complex regulatory component SIN3
VRFDSATISMAKLLADVTSLLHHYPKLESGFHPFLPPSWTMRGPTSL